jgi:threonine/homoserine/homoserine lactone efflux protein
LYQDSTGLPAVYTEEEVVGPLLLAIPALGTVLSAVVCVYFLYLACRLWHHGDLEVPEARPVTVRGVFLTTVLNPKALIFAFTLLPSDPSLTWAGVVPWLGGLSVLIVTVGACWIAIGASLRCGAPQVGAQLGCRAGSVALVLFAGVISGRAVGIA